MSVWLSVYLPLFISLFAYQSVCLSVFPSVSLHFACQFGCLFNLSRLQCATIRSPATNIDYTLSCCGLKFSIELEIGEISNGGGKGRLVRSPWLQVGPRVIQLYLFGFWLNTCIYLWASSYLSVHISIHTYIYIRVCILMCSCINGHIFREYKHIVCGSLPMPSAWGEWRPPGHHQGRGDI